MKNNITKVFTRFLQEGKATIKFKDPAHDIAISKVPLIIMLYWSVEVFVYAMYTLSYNTEVIVLKLCLNMS